MILISFLLLEAYSDILYFYGAVLTMFDIYFDNFHSLFKVVLILSFQLFHHLTSAFHNYSQRLQAADGQCEYVLSRKSCWLVIIMANIVHVGCNDSTVVMFMVEIRATMLYDQLRRQCNGLWSGHMNNKDISDFVGHMTLLVT